MLKWSFGPPSITPLLPSPFSPLARKVLSSKHEQRRSSSPERDSRAARALHEGAPGPSSQEQRDRKRRAGAGGRRHTHAHKKPLARGVARLGAKASDQRVATTRRSTLGLDLHVDRFRSHREILEQGRAKPAFHLEVVVVVPVPA